MSERDPAPTTRFDRDTAVLLVSAGIYRARFDAGWWAVVGPNGGYVAALHLRAMQHACADASRQPRSLHVRYLTPAVEGPIEIHVQTLRSGRSVTVLSARILQGGKEVSSASAAFGVPASRVTYSDATLPELPAPESCALLPKVIAINHRFEMRPVFGGPPRQGQRAAAGGYIRLEEPRPADALLLAALWDAWMPMPFYRQIEERFSGAAPTLEASIYFRTPQPTAAPYAHYFVRFESLVAQDGYFEESGEIWGPDGTLLAQSRQLAMLY